MIVDCVDLRGGLGVKCSVCFLLYLEWGGYVVRNARDKEHSLDLVSGQYRAGTT